MTAVVLVSLEGISSHDPGRDILSVSFRQGSDMARATANAVESVEKGFHFHPYSPYRGSLLV